METIRLWIDALNDVMWSYLLVGLLLGCAVWFTVRTRGVQFRMLGEMVRLLGESAGGHTGADGHRHVSSFQAFAVSLASRVGTGNLAGVATAIVVGGPGAVFWMWVIALVGAASAFVESTLAQLYKRRGRDSFVGGPAYYMERGLGRRWMGVVFAVLISVTFGFAFNSVQSNTICAAWEGAFGLDHAWVGVGLTVLTLGVIFGGIHRIARVSGVVVPVMALGYIALALGVVLFNLGRLPEVLELILADAFGWKQALGGGVGAALMQGIKRGLFSNEAGMGSAPNVAATARVSHPVKQGLIQTLGVFTDTLVICSCTAFIILFGGAPDPSLNGIQLTQAALVSEIGPAGGVFVAVAIFLFAFSSIIGNYYYGEANIRFITSRRGVLTGYRVLVGGMVLFGALTTLEMAWSLADVTMALMTLFNLTAILLLGRQALLLLGDYMAQKRSGIKNPVFTKDRIPELEDKAESW
ncbi:alanine/glycine:cation symporter family protein [Alistipes sp.]|uniref:alanine/glycine:cation symporter family protein n=1 Tax=Alistipes sp. TaxID=1872444 RepID=UPI003AF0697A